MLFCVLCFCLSVSCRVTVAASVAGWKAPLAVALACSALRSRFQAAADHSAAAQLPSKLAARWYGPYTVLEVCGGAVKLRLPAELGNRSDVVNVRRLRFAASRDVAFPEDDDVTPSPLADGSGVQRWEIRRICGDRIPKRRPELLVEWVGFDTSHLKWVHRDVLMQDVPAVVRAYDADPSAFKARASAPKRPTVGRQLPALRVQPPRAARAGA